MQHVRPDVSTICFGMGDVLIARHCGRTVERVMEDIDRDRFMAPAEAVEYGLVDDILVSPRNRPSTIAA